MENLTMKPWNFEANPEMLGAYASSDTEFHYFGDPENIISKVPKNAHTDLAVKALQVGAVCKIVKTATGFDVWLLDEGEVKEMFVKKV